MLVYFPTFCNIIFSYFMMVDWTWVSLLRTGAVWRENANQMKPKPEKPKPRWSKDRVEVSLLILFCRFHFVHQFNFHSNASTCSKIIILFSTVTPVTLLLSFDKKGPGGYLIRVDLIRFPGSIPGAIKMKMCASWYTLTILSIVGRGEYTWFKKIVGTYGYC